jgi:uncharacterized membrane protein YkoI
MDLIVFPELSVMPAYKRFVSKKVLIPAILGVGILLSVIFIVSPLVYTIAQQSTTTANEIDMSQHKTLSRINGSINIAEGITNFLKENTKIPFIAAAETAQQQIANGTAVGGHLSVTQGYLTYTYLVVNPTDETVHRITIDAGNGQVLSISQGQSLDSILANLKGVGFGYWKGHHNFFGHNNFFGGFWNGLPFGLHHGNY